jgi:hypothetical protein
VGIAIVSGALANKYGNGGATWTRLSWALGFKALGWRVCFVEQIDRASCRDAAGQVAEFEECLNRAYFARVTEQFGLAGSAALVYEGGEQTYGLAYSELLEVAGRADLLVNITGHLTLEPLLRRIRRKAYVDLDPGYTQFWHAAGQPGARLEGHEVYFTVGENVGTPDSPIPTDGIRWRPTRQPVTMEHWPVAPGGTHGRFTTVASWRGPYGPVEHGGTVYGLKVHEFRKFIDLPERAEQSFEIALDIHPADERDLELLHRHGWRIVDPRVAAPDPEAFRRYVQDSGAEFSVAQGIYVDTNSGWFSDRTVRYLASGKPALVQETGFSRNLPTGQGLLSFRTLDEAVEGADRLARDYQRHSRAARALAEAYFDADVVLGRFIDEAGVTT